MRLQFTRFTLVFGLAIVGSVAVAQSTPSIDWIPQAQPGIWDFESDPPGMLPSGWFPVAGQSDPGSPLCVVVDVVDMPVMTRALAIQPDSSPDSTNQAIATDTVYRNLDMTVRMRPDAGLHEQGGGLIWRWTDPGNYYVCRYSPLDGTFRVDKSIDGRIVELDSTDAAKSQLEGLQLAMTGEDYYDSLAAATEAPAPPSESPWLTLRVVMVGPEIKCYMNGELMLSAWDEEFLHAGLVGFWTKGDAATTFDDLVVTPLD